eukprot:TRINITY_DN88_c0_g1_i1.p1 TRINITY_DN88_c0_g1~~TRINITY_DN88_c0_g1_i1.p1  ORF type:complete len:247 (-),score=46.70 TRINITY_DN88_c0_g1_i1:226-966(-)
MNNKDFSVESLLAQARGSGTPSFKATIKDDKKGIQSRNQVKIKQENGGKGGKTELKDDEDFTPSADIINEEEEEEEEDDDSENDSSELKELQQTLRRTIASQKEQAKRKQQEIIQEAQTFICDKEKCLNEQISSGLSKGAETGVKQLQAIQSKMQGKVAQIQQQQEEFQKQVNTLWSEYQELVQQAENQSEELQKSTCNKKAALKRKLTLFKQEAQQQVSATEEKLSKARKSGKLANINKLLNQFM